MFAVTKVAKSTGRNYVSALPQRATPDSDFPHLLADIAFHHRCRSKGLRVRSPARRLPRPLAPATVGVFRSYRRTPRAFPLGGRWRAAPDEVSLVPRPRRSGQFRAPARAFLLSPTAPFLPTAEEMGERTPAETTFLHFLSAVYRLSMQSCALTQPAFSYPLSFRRLCQHSFPLPLPVTTVKIIRSAVLQAKK